MRSLEVLSSAHAIISGAIEIVSDPERWCARAVAYYYDGERPQLCKPSDPRATRWCAYGALRKCRHDLSIDSRGVWRTVKEAFTRAPTFQLEWDECAPDTVITIINDGYGREAALALLREAQAVLEVEIWFATSQNVLLEKVEEVVCTV